MKKKLTPSVMKQMVLFLSIILLFSAASYTSWSQTALPNPVCYGEPINLICNLNGCASAGATYSWTNLSGSWTSSQENPVIMPGSVGYASDKFYLTVLYSPPPGGLSAGRVNVVIRPQVLPTITGPASVCENSSGHVYTTQVGMTNYVWTVTGGTITSGGGAADNSVTVNWNVAGTHTVSVNYNNSYGCSAVAPAVYNVVVAPQIAVGISIEASANPVCEGDLVTFTATAVNGGASPTYQWLINGTNISGATATTYQYTPVNNDVVTCVLTSNVSCPSVNPVISNAITMTVNPVLPVSVSISASANPVCAGTSVTFTATPVNGGTAPLYHWYVNGTNVPGGTNSTYSFIPINGDMINCVLVSNESCLIGNPANSNPIIMLVTTAPTGVTASAITATTVNISWTAGMPSPAYGYEYEIRISGLPGSGTVGLVTSGTTMGVSVSITGLNSWTTYHAFIRSKCSDGIFSPWTADYIFTTMAEPNFRGILHHDTSISNSSAQAFLSSMGATVIEGSAYFNRVTIDMIQAIYDSLQQLPWVTDVDTNFIFETKNNESRSLIRVDKVQSSPWSNISNPYQLTGHDVNLGIWDFGIPDPANLDFTGRMTQMESIPICYIPSANVKHHPTHVAGTMAGNGGNSPLYTYAGMAPKAQIFAWYVQSQNCDINPPYPQDEMLNGFTNQSIVISQNSWGNSFSNDCSIFGKYTGWCLDMDKLVLDKGLSIFFAAGNSRQDANTFCSSVYGSILPLATAKNVVSVGAIDKNSNMASFSSWGPCDDGRLKPDVVAKGVDVKSSMPNGSSNPYQLASGTSMATPAVSGAAALLVERFRANQGGTTPSADLLKNFILNTADDWGPAGPDYQSGYGVVNVERAVQTIDKGNFVLGSVANQGIATFSLYVCSNQLKVMLAWSDMVGKISTTHHLINDLDIELQSPGGSVYLPLTLDPASPTTLATSGVNHRDNVEQVIVNSPAQGLWTIRVKGYAVLGLQNFSLTWIGGSNKGKDAYIQDVVLDYGNEPDLNSSNMWISPDILVRTSQYPNPSALNFDGDHQAPQWHSGCIQSSPPSLKNYVYVKIQNQSCVSVSGNVKVYWAKASPSLSWPSPWDHTVSQGLLMGDIIGTQPVSSLAPGNSTVLEFEWCPVNSDDYAIFGSDMRHFCLLAEFISPEDPMTFPAIPGDLYGYVRNNNNVAWKNIVFDFLVGENSYSKDGIIVGNYSGNSMTSKLVFETIPENNSANFFEYGMIRLNLADSLFDKWANGGFIGEGITHDDSAIYIHTSNAWIGNLQFDPGELYGVTVETMINNVPCNGEVLSFRLDFKQINITSVGENIVGGVSFRIRHESPPPLPVSVTIAASANPVCAGTQVTFTATSVNGGTAPGYHWQKNGINISAATNSTYSYIPANGDTITCVLTSNVACPGGNQATSNVLAPSVSTAETEPCGSGLNEGCNLEIPAFEPIALGETICGTSWCDSITRDTDWFIFSLTETKDITFSVNAEFPVLIGFVAAPCPAMYFIDYEEGAAGSPVNLNTRLAAGTYYAIVAPLDWSTIIACGGENAYLAKLSGNTCIVESFPFTESFNDSIFAPVCWLNVNTNGPGIPGNWDQQTSGTFPTCLPHSGTAMVRFNNREYGAGTKGILVTPKLALSSDQYTVHFWMYRDNGYSNNADRLNVYYNTNPNTTGAILLGTVNRNYLKPPIAASANQWYEYMFNMPAGSYGNSYIVFEGVSANGNNLFIDEVKVNEIFNCPAGSTSELEPCGQELNEGCNMEIPAFEALAPGETKCGTSWCDTDTRDTDWFTFTLTSNTNVTLTVNAEFPVELGLISAPCPAYSYIEYNQGMAGSPVSVTATLPAGTYYAVVTPMDWSTLITCGSENAYVVSLNGNFCNSPAVVTATLVTSTTVTISWTAPVPAPGNGYEYEIRTYGTAGSGSAGLASSGTTSAGILSADISVLSPNTAYFAYVRSNCGDNVYSLWSSPVQFTTLIPANTSIQNVNITDGQSFCYDAFQTITVGGTGTPFIVNSGGSATMIAGQKIQYLPGTQILTGGYMHGFIAQNGQYCSPLKISETEVLADKETSKEPISQSNNGFFKVYPNPTTGEFSLELTYDEETAELRIEIYGIQGERVLSTGLDGKRKYDFSLTGKPNGIYFIRVVTGKQTGTGKIIKQ